ncbi:hypothetical protein BSQ38_03680 [Pediococcus damnosus]|uniref:DNA-3-methyladenine glycosylase I n=1 Tax=Pediococcus damnosus TaxID=51663 RepID=UPI000C1C9B7E|nr:DNA-3-methyladenine glycosylase I [Pediococcus damnosus]PIO80808.1 hypothetical protein BSQ38_03680 [Pediococcus damnosus]
MNRCSWSTKNDRLMQYHDLEWGVPILESNRLFECFALEIFQAGLNWLTVLQRRQALRIAFSEFDPLRLSSYSPDEIQQVIKDPTVIRNARKIQAIFHNADVVTQLPMTFSDYIWHFVDFKPIRCPEILFNSNKAQELLAKRIVRQMKQDGFVFIGRKNIYAFVQAVGLINDHEAACFRYHDLAVL